MEDQELNQVVPSGSASPDAATPVAATDSKTAEVQVVPEETKETTKTEGGLTTKPTKGQALKLFYCANKKQINWWLKIVIPLILFLLFAIPVIDLDDANPSVSRGAAILILVACWWVFEPVPLGVTSFLPVLLIPVLGIASASAASEAYFSDIQFLFLGGFVLGEAMERWNVQQRVSLKVLSMTGMSPRLNLLGLVVVCFVLSMFMSNTAAAIACIPNGIAITKKIENIVGESDSTKKMAKAFVLLIAFAATIGGTGTLIGTPPNAIMVNVMKKAFNPKTYPALADLPPIEEISFMKWFSFNFPVAVLVMAVAYFVFIWLLCPKSVSQTKDCENTPKGDGSTTTLTSVASPSIDAPVAKAESPFKEEYKKLGPLSSGEKVVFAVFILAVCLWMFKSDIDFGGFVIPGWDQLFPAPKFIKDGTVGGLLCLVFFFISVRDKDGKKVNILDFKPTCKNLPWDVVLLMGGGFALSLALEDSGFSGYLGDQLSAVSDMHLLGITFIVCLMSTAMSNVASNTAMANIMLPIVSGVARNLYINRGIHPWTLMTSATLANSASFLLPVSTPPNTVAYATGRIGIMDFIKYGIIVNVTALFMYAFLVPVLAPLFYGYDATY